MSQHTPEQALHCKRNSPSSGQDPRLKTAEHFLFSRKEPASSARTSVKYKSQITERTCCSLSKSSHSIPEYPQWKEGWQGLSFNFHVALQKCQQFWSTRLKSELLKELCTFTLDETSHEHSGGWGSGDKDRSGFCSISLFAKMGTELTGLLSQPSSAVTSPSTQRMEEGFWCSSGQETSSIRWTGHGGAGVGKAGQRQTPARQYKAAAISWLALAMHRWAGTFFQLEIFLWGKILPASNLQPEGAGRKQQCQWLDPRGHSTGVPALCWRSWEASCFTFC